MKGVVFLLTLDTTVLGDTAPGTKLKFCRIYWKISDAFYKDNVLANIVDKIQIVIFVCFHRIVYLNCDFP